MVDAAQPWQPSCPSWPLTNLVLLPLTLWCAATPSLRPEGNESSRPPWATQGDVQGDTRAESVAASQTTP